MRLHRPGVIPLRPLTLGDIFNGALTTIRRNPEATIGFALLVLAGALIPSFVATLAVFQWGALATEDLELLVLGIPTLVSGIATLALTGFIIYVVSRAALGEKVGIGQTWRAVRGRLLALLGVTLLTVLVMMALVVAVIMLGVLTLTDGTGSIIAFVLLVIATMLVAFWLFIRLVLAPAAVVLERANPIRGLIRSWQLTRGKQGWRVLGIYLLASLVASLLSQALATPLAFAGAAIASGMSGTAADLVLAASLHLTTLLANAVVTPFTAGVVALLYLDMRFRFEGLDTTLLRTVELRAAQRRETGA